MSKLFQLNRWCVRQGFSVLLLGASLMSATAEALTIVEPVNGTFRELLAARELRRYVYLRTGDIATFSHQVPAEGESIVLMRAENGNLPFAGDASLSAFTRSLKPGEYLLHTIGSVPHRRFFIVGGDDTGLLNGAYRLCELLGVRFYLHGDVVPDAHLAGALPDVREVGRPLFALRGLLPFHDFPEGPDWWTRDDYRVHLAQMAKLRMNFFALHCYPEDKPRPNPEPHAEPLVWIGRRADQNKAGEVSSSYPAFWAATSRDRFWGYDIMHTGEFTAGASQLFAGEDHAHEIFSGLPAVPTTPEQENLVFERAAAFLGDALGFAHTLGLQTCIGTETPLTVPTAVRQRLQQEGQNPDDQKVVQELYAGMFQRIARRYPVDYYWLWTPESWTWSGNNDAQYQTTVADIQSAFAALDSLHHPFQLVTCGWVLGPVSDRTSLDRILPSGVPMSCISREVGHDLIEAGFKTVSDRPKWAIPWLENDQNLTSPQLWAGRMLYDAADAHNLGCSGLLGVHWRTKTLAPAISALAQAAWSQPAASVDWDLRPQLEKGALHTGHVLTAAETVSGVTGDEAEACRTSLEDCHDIYVMGVPNGRYRITLFFNESEAQAAGQRVFAVSVQDRPLVQNLDIYARAGGRNQAVRLQFADVAIGDSPLHLNLIPRQGLTSIAAIGVEGLTREQQDFSLWINLGGNAVGKFTIDYTRDKPPLAVRTRGLPVSDFYEDYCRANFGGKIAAQAAGIFSRIDGLGLPQSTHWDVGPGGIKPLKIDAAIFAFIPELAALRSEVEGPGNLQRFDYWLNTFRYQQALAETGGVRAELDEAVHLMQQAPDTEAKKRLAESALTIRLRLARTWETMMTRLLACVDTTGDLGTIANLEQHNRRRLQFLSLHDAAIAEGLGRALPAQVELSTRYSGAPRLVVPTVRGERSADEALKIPILALAANGMTEVTFHWRTWGKGEFKSAPAHQLSGAAYEALLPAGNDEIEYFVSARSSNGAEFHWPATSPQLCQTVIVLPAKE